MGSRTSGRSREKPTPKPSFGPEFMLPIAETEPTRDFPPNYGYYRCTVCGTQVRAAIDRREQTAEGKWVSIRRFSCPTHLNARLVRWSRSLDWALNYTGRVFAGTVPELPAGEIGIVRLQEQFLDYPRRWPGVVLADLKKAGDFIQRWWPYMSGTFQGSDERPSLYG
jgi:hypothetical protein